MEEVTGAGIKEWVGDRETGTRLSDGDSELIPETRWIIPYCYLYFTWVRLSETTRSFRMKRKMVTGL